MRCRVWGEGAGSWFLGGVCISTHRSVLHVESTDKPVIRMWHLKRTKTFFLLYFLVGENKLSVSTEIILLWCESLNPSHSVSAPLSSSSPAHTCFSLLYEPALLVLLHFAVPRIVLLAGSDLVLLFRQNGSGMQGLLWFTEVRFYSGIRDKQICAYTVGSQSRSHENSKIIK